jgi:hypothetical protein
VIADVVSRLAAAWAGAPLLFKFLFPVAVTVTVVDQVLKRVAPESRAYARFKHGLEAVGAFWTAIILSVVYFASVSLVNVFLRLRGADPLDRTMSPEPSFWRRHEPNPLGPLPAARHQF